MADTKVQNPEQSRTVARRQEYLPARDLFGFSPFAMMRRLSEEMDRALGSSFGLWRGAGEGMWTPPIEVSEHDGNLEIVAELPGMTKDDVKVECTDEGIVIEGEKRREFKSEEHGVHRSERSYGRFCRIVPLPEGTDASKIKADFKNGVLHVQAPISEQHRKVRQIPIST